MNKQEVLEAINATIAPNNIKGITAESLNNVLTMMTENAGEGGSGDGALRVIVPDMMLLGPMIFETGVLSPSSWAAMRPELETSLGGIDLSEYEEVVNASFAHNANVAQQILDKARAGQGVSVVLDQTPYSPAVINMVFQMEPEMAAFYEDFVMCGTQPAGLFMQYIKPTTEGESTIEMSETFACILVPTGYINDTILGIANYPSDMIITLNLDGSLTFTQIEEEEQPSSGSGVVTFYAPSGETLTSEEQAKNKAAYESWVSAETKPSIIMQASGMAFVAVTAVQQSAGALNLGILDPSGAFSTIIIGTDGSVTM